MLDYNLSNVGHYPVKHSPVLDVSVVIFMTSLRLPKPTAATTEKRSGGNQNMWLLYLQCFWVLNLLKKSVILAMNLDSSILKEYFLQSRILLQ
jgi:hypothetical protein